ncbi:hypothetical protein ACFL27_25210 [candidate division CSSED10-310 bacterium]|uniref:Uncharacterized protein n=1 Tax=candidate division CSSED10-310 bacterium TaxID=2855610 RepID=A0ABV6Z502_UNCC1
MKRIQIIELKAIEQNDLAVRLRDQGKIDEARQTLIMNSNFLKSNAARFKSKKLGAYAAENFYDAENLEGDDWIKQRKSMRENQFQRTQQQIEPPEQEELDEKK